MTPQVEEAVAAAVERWPLRRVGRSAQAREAYGRAIELAGNTAEVAHLTRRRDQLGGAAPRP